MSPIYINTLSLYNGKSLPTFVNHSVICLQGCTDINESVHDVELYYIPTKLPFSNTKIKKSYINLLAFSDFVSLPRWNYFYFGTVFWVKPSNGPESEYNINDFIFSTVLKRNTQRTSSYLTSQITSYYMR